jgi:DNA-binding NarL/FixJ family response regulator
VIDEPLVRVFLVDDHQMFRAGVRSELGDAVDVVGEADEVDPAIEMIGERNPDVVLLDVHLPGGGGRAVLEGVKRTHPEVKFLALSVSDAPEDVIAVIRAGARGYVTKTISGTPTRRLRPRRVLLDPLDRFFDPRRGPRSDLAARA